MLGLMLENGPLHVAADGSMIPNQFSWDKLVDYIWVDQPVYVDMFHSSFILKINEKMPAEQDSPLRNQMEAIVSNKKNRNRFSISNVITFQLKMRTRWVKTSSVCA